MGFPRKRVTMYKSILTWVAIITLVLTGMVQTAWALSFNGYQEMWACHDDHSFSLDEDSGLRFTVVWNSTLHPFAFGIHNSDGSLYYTSRKFTDKQSGDTFYPDFALGPGSYSLYFTSCVSWGGHGNYTISAQVITPRFQNDTEPNDDLADSQWVSIPGVIEGHLGYMDNEKVGPGGSPFVSKTDNFIGDINRKGKLYVTFDSDDTLCMYSFLIYNEDGEYVGGHILGSLLCKVPGVEYGPYPINKKGGYLIVCTNDWKSGEYGSYRLKTRMEYDHSGESAPIVVSTDPMPNERNVSLRKEITIVFSELMDHSTLTYSHIFVKEQLGSGFSATLPYDIGFHDHINSSDPSQSHTTVTLFPKRWPLGTNTEYFITVEGVKDTDGDPIDAPYSEPFKTTSKQDPAVVAAQVNAMFLLLGIGP